MVEDWRLLAEEHPEILADLFQMTLMACGMAPVVGEMCDMMDAVVSASRGDWFGSFLALGSMVPVAGWGPRIVQAAMTADRYREALKYVAMLARGCPRGFTSATAGRFEPTDTYYVPDHTVIVRGGQGDLPRAGTRFSGAMGRSVEDAGGAVPDSSIRVTTAGAIRAAGGTVEYAPDEGRNGWMNYKHVNVTLGGSNPFSEVRSKPHTQGRTDDRQHPRCPMPLTSFAGAGRLVGRLNIRGDRPASTGGRRAVRLSPRVGAAGAAGPGWGIGRRAWATPCLAERDRLLSACLGPCGRDDQGASHRHGWPRAVVVAP